MTDHKNTLNPEEISLEMERDFMEEFISNAVGCNTKKTLLMSWDCRNTSNVERAKSLWLVSVNFATFLIRWRRQSLRRGQR